MIAMARIFTPSPPQLARIPYSDFKAHLAQVKSVNTTGRNIDGEMKSPVYLSDLRKSVVSFTTQIPSSGDTGLESQLEQQQVVVNDMKIYFDWDVVGSAIPFATLAAILAGFVIISIVAMLTFKPDAGDTKFRYLPLIPFLGAFFTLVVAAFLFSVLAGDGATGGNRLLPLAEGYFLSFVFGSGVVQTCVGIAWLLDVYRTSFGHAPVKLTARWIVHMTVGLVGVSTAGVLVQPLFVLYSDQGNEGMFAWALMAALPILAIPIGNRLRPIFAALRPRERKDSATTELPGQVDHLVVTTGVAMVFVLLAAIGYGAATVSTEQAVRAGYGLVFTILVVAQLLLCGVFAAYESSLPLLPSEEEKLSVAAEGSPA